MRGADQKQEAMFSYISPEKRVPGDHPLRAIREMGDQVLEEMSPRERQSDPLDCRIY